MQSQPDQPSKPDQPPLPRAVLGIDASLKRTGFAVARFGDPWVRGTETVEVGAIEVQQRKANTDPERIDAIAKASVRWAQDHAVDLVAIEKPWTGRNYSVGLRLQALTATIADRCRQAGFRVIDVYPAQASAAMGVSSRLKRPQRKAAMQRAALHRYGITSEHDDEADAAGVAVGGYLLCVQAIRDAAEAEQRAKLAAQSPPLPGMGKYKPRETRKRKGARR